MANEQITIKPTDEFTVKISGADYAAIDAAIKKLPYEVAAPLLASFEKQIIEQINQTEPQ